MYLLNFFVNQIWLHLMIISFTDKSVDYFHNQQWSLWILKKSQKMLITISQSPKWHLQMAPKPKDSSFNLTKEAANPSLGTKIKR